MSEDLIRYDVLTQEALRGVVRKVLEEVVVTGLPGEHHFFITFDTTHSGVRLSNRMRERYPESMTIVIQHTYWNLKVSESEFELDLTFNDIKERLKIPFMAIQAFFDPSVKFGLQFDPESANEIEVADDEPQENGADAEKSAPVSIGKKAKADTDDEKTADTKAEPNEAAGEVVSLDAFRKKK
ncbi:MAG: ClpXP protease specificity-enhancing factor SspB [Salaquimonas sp.]